MDSDKLEKALAPMLAESGFEITDIRQMRHNGKPLLQFFVDRSAGGGVTLDDCAGLTEKIGAHMDMNSLIEGGYIIEVSSPGIDRVLRKEKDFIRFSGSKAKIRLKKPLDKCRVYYGELAGVENGQLVVSGGLKFNLEDLDEVRLNPDDDDIFNKAK